MKRLITRAEAAAFRMRWAAVNAAERKELRATSPEKKARQLAALMASAQKLGWTKARAQEESLVRERWNRLRKACRA